MRSLRCGPGLLALSLGALLVAASCAQTASQTAPKSTDQTANASSKAEDELFRPERIFRILEKSDVLYEITDDKDLRPTAIYEIVEPPEPAKTVNSYLELKRRSASGDDELVISEPPEAIRELHELAFRAFHAHNFQEAVDYYMQALEVQPDYFKTYTYLGNTFFILGDLARAERALKKALEMNGVDYQAHLFLGDTYYQMGRFEEAKQHLTHAFMLNQNNPVVRKRLDIVLDKFQLRRRGHRLSPRIEIERVGDKKVAIRFDKGSGVRWFPLANCLACWSYEAECKSRDDAPSLPVRMSMYRECLLNQAMSIGVRLEKEYPVPLDELVLYRAIREGYLEAIVFWEIAAKRSPIIVFLLDEQDRAKILEYIEKYVFDTGTAA